MPRASTEDSSLVQECSCVCAQVVYHSRSAMSGSHARQSVGDPCNKPSPASQTNLFGRHSTAPRHTNGAPFSAIRKVRLGAINPAQPNESFWPFPYHSPPIQRGSFASGPKSSAWRIKRRGKESNLPRPVNQADNGFEDRGDHQEPITPRAYSITTCTGGVESIIATIHCIDPDLTYSCLPFAHPLAIQGTDRKNGKHERLPA